MHPRTKFLFQVTAGILMLVSGFGIYLITNPLTGKAINLGLVGIPFTILWVIGIANALNLVDGMDGLASGVSFFASLTIFGIAFLYQNIGIVLVSIILTGSIFGFLQYNYPPATIFLGDSGSLLLGFLLSVLSLEGVHKGAALVAIIAPILALGLPIMDTLLSMIRRFLKSIYLLDYPTTNGIINKRYFQAFIDLFFFSVSYYACFILIFGEINNQMCSPSAQRLLLCQAKLNLFIPASFLI